MPKTISHIKTRKFFLDSGAHSLYNKYVKGKSLSEAKKFFKSTAFKQWCRAYALFIKQHRKDITIYVNLDMIYCPEVSWDNQKRLEEVYGLKPIPVIHHNTPLKWIEKYIESGHTYLGIGGIGQKSNFRTYTIWADQVFSLLCSTPNKLPAVDTHGFAMTSSRLVLRYPWTSVDSSTHRKCAGYGQIRLPRTDLLGNYDFFKPLVMFVSEESSRKFDRKAAHLNTFRSRGTNEEEVSCDKTKVLAWLKDLNLPLGTLTSDGYLDTWGIMSDYSARVLSSMLYFKKLQEQTTTPFTFKRLRASLGTSLASRLENCPRDKEPGPITVYFVETPGASLCVPEEYRSAVQEADILHSFILYYNESMGSWSKEQLKERFSKPIMQRVHVRYRSVEDQLERERKNREAGKTRNSRKTIAEVQSENRDTKVIKPLGIPGTRS